MKKITFAVFVLAALLTFSGLNMLHPQPNVQAALSWTKQTVATVGEGYASYICRSSVALDSFGNPHISYWESPYGVRYASWTGSTWAFETVDAASYIFTSLVLDSSDNPHISYCSGALKYADKVGGSWYAITVDEDSSCTWCSMKLDSNGYPHICYVTGIGSLYVKYAWWTPWSEWSTEYVATSSSTGYESTSLALDSMDKPHVTMYHWNGNVYYTNKTGDSWGSPVSVESGLQAGSGDCSIALDSLDRPYIAYYEDYADGTYFHGYLKLARWNGATWSIETVDGLDFNYDWPGQDTSIVIDYMDRPHISYKESWWPGSGSNNFALKYAWWTGTTWSIESADWDYGKNVGGYSSLAVSPYGTIGISYLNYTMDAYGNPTKVDLKYATTTNPDFDTNEYFYSVDLTTFDSDGDDKDDAIKAVMDVDSNYAGTQKVGVYAILYDPYDIPVAWNFTTWYITDADWDYGEITLYTPPGYGGVIGEGWCDLELELYDSRLFPEITPPLEDTRTYNDIRYLYPPAPTVLVVRGNDNQIYYRRCYRGDWWDWKVVPSGATSDSPAAAVLGKELHMVVRGMDGSSLWYGSIDLLTDSFSGWAQLDGATPSAPTLISDGTRLCLVVRGMDNRIFYRYRLYVWDSWQVVLTGATCDSPAAAMLDSDLHIVVRGMDANSLWDIIVGSDGSVLRDWRSMSGATSSKPALAARWANLYLFVRGLDDGIWYRRYFDSMDTWGSWSSLPGSTVDGPGTTVFYRRVYVVVRGSDGNSLWFLDGISWSLLSGATPSAPTLTS